MSQEVAHLKKLLQKGLLTVDEYEVLISHLKVDSSLVEGENFIGRDSATTLTQENEGNQGSISVNAKGNVTFSGDVTIINNPHQQDILTQVVDDDTLLPKYLKHLIGENYYLTSPSIPIQVTAPSPPPKFVGRDENIYQISSQLMKTGSENKRLILQGMGGIGKTSTMLKIAEKLRKHFPGGIFWASLPDYNGDVNTILFTWARLCGHEIDPSLHASDLTTWLRGILSATSTKERLLVLIDDIRIEWINNAQTLLKSIPYNVPVLITTRDMKIATSLDGEIFTLGTLTDEEAISMLILYSNKEYKMDDLETAKNLLQKIGKLPLAIELAGKYIKIKQAKPGFSIKEVYHAFSTLNEPDFGLPGHQGLALSFEVSYKSLSSFEQQVFRWIGAFATKNISLEYLSEIMLVSRMNLEIATDNLVLSSLLSWEPIPLVYSIHPLLHEYAKQKLRESTQLTEAKKNHSKFFVTKLIEAVRHPVDYNLIDNIYPDINHTVKWLIETKNRDTVLQIANMLFIEANYLQVRGNAVSSVFMLENIVANYEKKDIYQLKIITQLTNAYLQLGRFQEVIEICNKHLLEAKNLDRNIEVSLLLMQLAIAHSNLGQYHKSLEYYESSYEYAKNTNDYGQICRVMSGMGQCNHNLVRYDEAQKYYKQAIEIIKTHKLNTRTETTISGNIAHVFRSTGEIIESIKYYQNSLSIDRKIGYSRGIANWLGGMAVSYIELGNSKKALEALTEALEITRRIGDRRYEGNWLCRTGQAYMIADDFDNAKNYLQLALSTAREVRNAQMISFAGGYLAYTFLLTNSLQDAVEAIEIALGSNIPFNNHCVDAIAGIIFSRLEDWIIARRHFKNAITRARDVISQTPRFFAAHYAQAIGYAGLSSVNKLTYGSTNWSKAYSRLIIAQSICSAYGVRKYFTQQFTQAVNISTMILQK